MDLNKLFIVALILIAAIGTANAAIVTDSVTTDGTYWTVPAGVYSISNLTVIAAGGSGLGGGYVYKQTNGSIFFKFDGPGGLSGTKTVYNNIAVTPGTSIQVHIGQPGQSPVGYLGICPATGTSSFDVPSLSYTGYDGGASYVIINGVTYSSAGGSSGRVNILCTTGVPSLNTTNNYNINGQNGYLTPSILAQSGSPTVPPGSGITSYGGYGGPGYGGGGGGGGMGWNTDPNGGAGSGGVGAPGIIQFSYESSTAQPYYPTGYVYNYTHTAIQSASVTITQLLNTVSTTTDSSGHYSVNSNYIVNVPVNITITKTGYTPNYNIFTPLESNTVIYTTLLDANRTCAPPCIDGLATNGWTNSTVSGAIAYLQPVSGGATVTTTSNTAGYYNFTGLIAGSQYYVWSSLSGYGNSSTHTVTAVGV